MESPSPLLRFLQAALGESLRQDPISMGVWQGREEAQHRIRALAFLCQEEGLPVRERWIEQSNYSLPLGTEDSKRQDLRLVTKVWLETEGAWLTLDQASREYRLAILVVVPRLEAACKYMVADTAGELPFPCVHVEVQAPLPDARVNGVDLRKMRPFLVEPLARLRRQALDTALPAPSSPCLKPRM